MEFGSYVILYSRGYEPGLGVVRTENILTKEEISSSKEFVTDNEILSEWNEYAKNNFKFKSYLMHGNRRWVGKFINVNEKGNRETGNTIKKDGAQVTRIWFLGSSTLFGTGTVSDRETIPSYVERMLNQRHPDKLFKVINYAVPGYNTTQETLQFKFELTSRKPDVAVTFNGRNDVWQAMQDLVFKNPTVGDTLSYFWEFHVNHEPVNWSVVRNWLPKIVPNTLHLLEVAQFWFKLRAARSDIEAWKKSFIQDARRNREAAEKNIRLEQNLFQLNLETLIGLSRSRGIKVVLSHQPSIYISTKKLLPHTATLLKNSQVFAPPPTEIAKLTEVPAFRLEQSLHDLEQFKRAYFEHIRLMKSIAQRYSVPFINSQAIVDTIEGPLVSG